MSKIGIFGGSFNPPHLGHLNSVQTVQKKIGLDKVVVIPTYKNPLRTPIEGPTAEHRLEMTRLAFADMGEKYLVDPTEVNRRGESYTYETLQHLSQKYKKDEFYLILGADAFQDFDHWKKPEEILRLCHLIVTSRPGYDLPQTTKELPRSIQASLLEMQFNFVELNTGKTIQFVTLSDMAVSATELRKNLRVGKKVDQYLPLSVEKYIKENSLYQPLGDRIGDFEQFTKFCANTLFSKKAIKVRGFDLRPISAPSEFTLIASGTSTKHSASLADNVIHAVKEEYNVFPQSVEGKEEGRWVVLDYGSLIVHVFYDFVRQEYALENLWNQGLDMKLIDPGVQ